MLRTNTKKGLMRIIKSISSICVKASVKEDAVLISALQESQDALIAVGERLEKEIQEESKFIIEDMELLCECFYQLSQDLDNRTLYNEQITKLLVDISAKIEHLPSSYQIVFFPYKADMWDSLESVWLACKEDSFCDCKVVPIPYYHYNANTNEWEYHYEIDCFPEYVPVVDYVDYDLTECADAAFIHNPYDQYNRVTNVHSDYFSYNLKKYVKNLFYVPYYVTTGFVAEDHKKLSAYMNADYLIVQSESFKEGLKPFVYYEKAYVMGSPKLDRIIRLSDKKDGISEEWRRILKDKKVLMLNTSLNQFLYDGEIYLQKLRYLFELVKKYDNVVIIWRPHPLLQSTIESMRPYLLNTYLELKTYFIEEKLGIFDNTSDIISSVVAADAYVGEMSSSVVNLFEAAGKPLFILNNYIRNGYSEKEKVSIFLSDCCQIGDKIYCISAECNGIFGVEKGKWSDMQKLVDIPSEGKWLPISSSIVYVDEDIYMTPYYSEEFYSYNIRQKKLKQISKVLNKSIQNYRFSVVYKHKVFFFPNKTKKIMEYNTCTRNWKEYMEPIHALQKNINEHITEDVGAWFVNNNEVWMTTLYSNRVLCFNMDTRTYQIYEIGTITERYSAIAVKDKTLFLSNADTGNIFAWNYELKEQSNQYSMPKDYRVFPDIRGRYVPHSDLLVIKDYLIAVPCMSNMLVRIDLQTGKSIILAKDFFEDVLLDANLYKATVHGVVTMAKMLDNTNLLVQKRRDASLLELNVHTGAYKVHYPKLTTNELEKMLENEDGFEKSYANGEFARRESKYFSFEDFLDDLVNDRLVSAMARQKKEMGTMAVNLDGTCGEKVHEFLVKILEKE